MPNQSLAAVIAAPYSVAWVPKNTMTLPNSKISLEKAMGRVVESGLTLVEACSLRDILIRGARDDGFYITF